jgi:hypothetical protein
MKRNLCVVAALCAAVCGTLGWAPAASADDRGLSDEEKNAQAAVRRDELHSNQMKGLTICVIAVAVISATAWALNSYNKMRKVEAERARRKALHEGDLYREAEREREQPVWRIPSEPSAGDW